MALRPARPLSLFAALCALLLILVLGLAPAANAEGTRVGLGTAEPFAVLASSEITNTGPSVISGDIGVSPGTAVSGFLPGLVINGVIHQTVDGVALSAQGAATSAYNDGAGRPVSVSGLAELGSPTPLTAGVYSGDALQITGTVILQGGPDDVFIFQAASTLITASSSTVALVGEVDPCNVFWVVGSSTTLGSSSSFVGTVISQISVTAGNLASVEGRLIARSGAVTLDTNRVTAPICDNAVPTSSAGSSTTATVGTDTGATVSSSADGTTVGSTPGTTSDVPETDGGVVPPALESVDATSTPPNGVVTVVRAPTTSSAGSSTSATNESGQGTSSATTTPGGLGITEAENTTSATVGTETLVTTTGPALSATGPARTGQLTVIGLGAVLLGLGMLVLTRRQGRHHR